MRRSNGTPSISISKSRTATTGRATSRGTRSYSRAADWGRGTPTTIRWHSSTRRHSRSCRNSALSTAPTRVWTGTVSCSGMTLWRGPVTRTPSASVAISRVGWCSTTGATAPAIRWSIGRTATTSTTITRSGTSLREKSHSRVGDRNPLPISSFNVRPHPLSIADVRVRVIHLYHCADARSFRPLWALEELGLGYELTVMPFPPRYRAKEFMAVNPLGTIPVLVDGETFMTESAAIVQYLATRYGPSPLAVDLGDSAYGVWLNWLHFGEATLTFPQTLVLRYRRLEPGKAEVVADDYAKWFLARLRAVDRALQGAEHLCAGRFTAADISVGYALLLAEQVGLDAKFTPAIAAYWARLQARSGFKAAKSAQEKHAPVSAEASQV